MHIYKHMYLFLKKGLQKLIKNLLSLIYVCNCIFFFFLFVCVKNKKKQTNNNTEIKPTWVIVEKFVKCCYIQSTTFFVQ